MGKVLGAFFVSALLHAAAASTVNGGKGIFTCGDFSFFFLNGLAVLVSDNQMISEISSD